MSIPWTGILTTTSIIDKGREKGKGREGLETEVHARYFSLGLHWGAGPIPKTIRVAPSQPRETLLFV